MNCLHCGVVKKSPTVSCDGCQGPLHVSCVGLSENGFKITKAKSRSLKVVCNQCNANMSQFKDIKSLISALQFQFTSAIDSLRKEFEEQLNSVKSSIQLEYQPSNNTIAVEEVLQEMVERQRRSLNLWCSRARSNA